MQNHYYSGQGSLYYAERDANGDPKGFERIGNVPDLTIDIEVTKFEHKESETGNRLLDLTLIKEKKGKFKFKLENLDPAVLALGFYGVTSAVVGATVTAEAVTAYKGKRNTLAHPSVSAVSVVVSHAGAPARQNTTAYALGDYYVPAVANAHYYKVTVAGTSAGSPPVFTLDGTTFADGTATVKDMGPIIKTVDTDYTVDGPNGVLTILSTGTIADTEPLEVDYTYGAYVDLEAFTTAVAPERWLRFEGLNTVDGSRVIVDLFKAQIDPLTNYGLIVEELASVDISGSLMADSLRVSGSQFFRQRNIDA